MFCRGCVSPRERIAGVGDIFPVGMDRDASPVYL